MVPENVSKTAGMKAGLEILIVIEAPNTGLARDSHWIVHD